ncbi:ATP citrate lyase subunit B 2 [Actinidia rufa]|uniref:ATP citrate lyase subunit B 2 n=1 Tax=Actinidia rufa TaxID=165716 RepID=A0A7J0GED2_9ERIC|nr:ATP citrate lyase subunit B 2 [Actinidia rufa]
MFTKPEIDEIVGIGYLNGLFVLARSIGLIGHTFDQKRLKQPLYRHPWEDVLYTNSYSLSIVTGRNLVFNSKPVPDDLRGCDFAVGLLQWSLDSKPVPDDLYDQDFDVRELEGTSNPVVTSILGRNDANFVNIEDETVDEVPNPTRTQKIESCLLEWNVDGIFTLTADNATSNNHTIKFLTRKTKYWKRTVLEHKQLHMRCCAHILNLIVVEGLSENSESILRVRDVVRYVRSSPQRLESFKKCVEKEKLDLKKNVCLDVSTRWNSTYLMLETAEKFEKAFQRMAEEDNGFQTYFGVMEGEECEDGDDGTPIQRQRGSGSHRVPILPTKLDWKNCRMFVKFLKLFYDATKKFSASLFVTSNTFFDEIISIEMAIAKLIKNYDPLLSQMALNMQKKFDKYWGWNDKSKGVEVGEAMEKLVKSKLNELYDAYAKENEVRVEAPIATPTPTVVMDDDLDVRSSLYNEFDTFCDQEFSSACSSEVDKYLVELCERKENPSFDILLWWKTNSNKYPILTQIARDVLALPVSTVASYTVPINLRHAMDKVEDLERELLQEDGQLPTD